MSTSQPGATTNPAADCPIADNFDPLEGDPRAFFARARREHAVFYSPPLDAYVITRYADCERVLKEQEETFTATPALMPNVAPTADALAVLAKSGHAPVPTLVDKDGEPHRLHRSVTQPPFRRDRASQLEEFVRQNVRRRLDAVAGQGAADIVDAMIYEVPAATILHMMGVAERDMGFIKELRGPWAVFRGAFPHLTNSSSGFTKTAAKELAHFGVTVNAISPSAETRMVGAIPAGKREELEALTPLGRWGHPSEMAAAVTFLASEEAGYVTGVVLPVDGGISMRDQRAVTTWGPLPGTGMDGGASEFAGVTPSAREATDADSVAALLASEASRRS